jgi:AraC-like DNA-binding protein
MDRQLRTCVFFRPMPDTRIDVDYGPPIIPHRIRGRRNADLPVGGIEVLLHRHARLAEWRMIDAITKQWALYWPTAGRARMVHAGEAHDVRKGMLLLLPPHTTFSTECKPGFAKWYIHFEVAGVGDALRPGIFPIQPSRRMLALLASTCPATIEKGRSSDHTAAKTLDLIDLLSLAVRDRLPKLQAPGFFGVDADRVLRVLHEQSSGGATLHDLAEATSLTERSLSELVLRTTGFTPMRYLLEIRLNTAMKLLRHTDHSIEQIARECGFGDRYYFTRIFTKHRQTTPAAFRKEARA